ncbi:MAG: hypothetical protein MUC87_14910 [Bacteroidia bacterium]|jgi:hypothetical protein|nr:hypothetical protein [Bacteroidia bacterium]
MNTTHLFPVIRTAVMLAVSASVFLNTSCRNRDDDDDQPAPTAINLCSNPTQSLTNWREGADYIVDCQFTVGSGTLTIAPGTEIQFSSGGSIVVENQGRIDANGTAAAPIRFVPTAGTPFWGGVLVFSSSVHSLAFCEFVNAGVAGAFSFPFGATAALHVGKGTVNINNCTVRNAAGDGVYFNDYDVISISSFANNTIRDNNGFPVVISVALLNNLNLTNNQFTGNGTNRIRLYNSDPVGSLNGNITWNNPGIPFEFSNSSSNNINIQQSLTINAGVTLFVENGFSIQANGTFAVNGTAAQPVIIQGKQSLAGWWHGINVVSNSVVNNFSYLTVSDGGGNTWIDSDVSCIAVGTYTSNPAQLTMSNCTVRNSPGCGIETSATAVLNQTGTTFVNVANNICN